MEPEELFVKRFSELITNGKYTLEEVGYAIGIKSKSTISKYLSGNIKNIKRSQIVKLGNLFNVSPAWLAGLSDEKYDTHILGNNNQFIQEQYGENSIELLNNYNKLNELGKQKANENVRDLTKISEYTENIQGIQKTKSQNA